MKAKQDEKLAKKKYITTESKKQMQKVADYKKKVKARDITIKEQDDIINAQISDANDVSEYIEACRIALCDILVAKGYPSSEKELSDVIADVMDITEINPSKLYNAFQFDDNGYVTGMVKADYVLEAGEIPDDWNKGYWTVIHGKWVLDKERMNLLWSVI